VIFTIGGGGEGRGRLLALYDRLEPRDRETLLALAEFLASRREPVVSSPPEPPRLIPRPARESVVGAIRRLSASYPMVDRRRLLDATSSLMTQHILQGRPAEEVIGELERTFDALYQEILAATRGPEEPPEPL
jgi:hypothetical protein